jgi:hypothetical protein
LAAVAFPLDRLGEGAGYGGHSGGKNWESLNHGAKLQNNSRSRIIRAPAQSASDGFAGTTRY